MSFLLETPRRALAWAGAALFTGAALYAAADPRGQASASFRRVKRDPRIARICDSVNSTAEGSAGAELLRIVNELTGETPTTIGGQAYDFSGTPYGRWQRSTQFGSDAITKAVDWTREYMMALPLDAVTLQRWSGVDDTYRESWGGGTGVSGTQVIGELTGTTRPREIVILCGHLDSVAYEGVVPMDFVHAPGADDNMTAAATTLVAAKLLSWHKFRRTIRFACWTGEEQGLLGALAYARQCRKAREKVVAVVNLEMIGRDPDGDASMELHTRTGRKKADPFGAGAGDLVLAKRFTEVVNEYSIEIAPKIVRDAQSYSDHAAFWTYRYNAIGVEEQELKQNPTYHTSDDTVGNLTWPFFTKMAGASIATVAHLAGIR